MVLLLLMSVVSLISLKGIKTDERMAGNLQDRYLAFQAAESGLRAGEAVLDPKSTLPPFDGTSGLYSFTDQSRPSPFELDADNARLYTNDLYGIPESQRPRYMIELMEAGVEQGDSLVVGVNYGGERRASFRITALGLGRSATTRVVLQTTYRR